MSIDIAAIHNAAPSARDVALRLGLEIAQHTRRDDKVTVLCPWHNERQPSCDIAKRDGRIVAVCRSCGEGGDLLSLVAARNGLDVRDDFVDVARIAADLVGVRIDENDAPMAPRPQRTQIEELAQRAHRLSREYARGTDLKPPPGGWPAAEDRAAIDDMDPDILHKALLLAMQSDRPAPEPVYSVRVARREPETAERAARRARWARYPVYDGPIHLVSDGPPPAAYLAHVAAVKAWEESR